jgi:arsenate reductase
MARVLFVCVANAARSQMSRAFFERLADGHRAESAGTHPAERIHPRLIGLMNEVGIDISGRKPRKLTPEMVERADIVVTMGCGDECPYFPGKRYIDWALPDPKGLPDEEVRRIRDEIEDRVRGLVEELG